MTFEQPLVEGRLLRRYKRFLADVQLPDGEVITAHTANTGAMTGCAESGRRVWLSRSDNPKRKYPHTWELIEVRDGVLAGINTQLSNLLVREAIENGRVPELAGYGRVRSEVRYGEEKSRIDLLLDSPDNKGSIPCYIEVKNVTLVDDGIARFPDAVSVRASKHLRELMSVVRAGQRAVIFFCVQRGDVREVRPADQIDPLYGETLREAVHCGVECLAYASDVSMREIVLRWPLPVRMTQRPNCFESGSVFKGPFTTDS
ncbi:MAG TPA: DNA/RNA nuclease SfsA [Chromatiales bacterium]|nr:DNA/RNA nuclease SfsA [Chromatiales bacterium]HEX22538.1 DNA/RNA nuclease SfsA [Chromatiales bacterium]